MHKVETDDTLSGLSLKYNISIASIQNANKIHGEDIYYFKELIIPNPAEFNNRPMDNDYAEK